METVQLTSFGYRHGAPVGPMFFIDCRVMLNPHNVFKLRPLIGCDLAVQEFVKRDIRFNSLFELALNRLMMDGDLHLAFGCYGGRHRSVAMAELVAGALAERGAKVRVNHRELNTQTIHGVSRD
jgi:RNase adapter protein RapZ